MLRRRFMLLSFCIHVLSFVFISFHIPFMFIPMWIHFLSSSLHLNACFLYFAFMSFHFLSKVIEMILSLGQGTECNKCLSLRLSLWQRDTESDVRVSWMPNDMLICTNLVEFPSSVSAVGWMCTIIFALYDMISGWWFQPLWKILVSWDEYSKYLVK